MIIFTQNVAVSGSRDSFLNYLLFCRQCFFALKIPSLPLLFFYTSAIYIHSDWELILKVFFWRGWIYKWQNLIIWSDCWYQTRIFCIFKCGKFLTFVSLTSYSGSNLFFHLQHCYAVTGFSCIYVQQINSYHNVFLSFFEGILWLLCVTRLQLNKCWHAISQTVNSLER